MPQQIAIKHVLAEAGIGFEADPRRVHLRVLPIVGRSPGHLRS